MSEKVDLRDHLEKRIEALEKLFRAELKALALALRVNRRVTKHRLKVLNNAHEEQQNFKDATLSKDTWNQFQEQYNKDREISQENRRQIAIIKTWGAAAFFIVLLAEFALNYWGRK